MKIDNIQQEFSEHFEDKSSDVRTLDLPVDGVVEIPPVPVDRTTFDVVSIREFLSRPVKVSTLTWTPGTSLATTISLANYLALVPVKHKLNQFARARFTQSITVSLTASPFYSGSLLLSALPLGTSASSNLEPVRLATAPVNADFVRLSQRPHVFMSVNKSQTHTLRLPYFNTYDWFNLNNTETLLTTNPYTLYLHSINNLQHCNGSTDPVIVNILFALEDLELEVPTTYYAASREVKPVSKTMEKYAKMGDRIGNILPVIKPYMTPLTMAAHLGAELAKVAGFSRPFSIRDPVVRSHNPMSLTDQPDVRPVMGLSAGNTIGLGAELGCSSEMLDMDIRTLASRFSYLSSYTWSVASAPDTSLVQFGVTPVVYRTNGTNPVEYHYPAISYLSLPFTRWSGSIKYKFQAIASAMHRGKLRITWDPYPTTDINVGGFYSTPITCILDLETDHEVTLEVPHHSIYNSMEISDVSWPVALGPNVDFVNGYITVSVMNSVTTPNSTVATPVFLNVWIAAGADYQIYQPTCNNIATASYFAASRSAGEKDPVDRAACTNGECIMNIRALVKRESPTYAYAFYSTNTGHFLQADFDRPVFRGTKGTGNSRNVTTGPLAKAFDFGINNFLTHYEMCFAGRRGGYVQRYNVSQLGYNVERVETFLRDWTPYEDTPIVTYPQGSFTSLAPASTNPVNWAHTFASFRSGAAAHESDTFTGTISGRKPFYSNLAILPNWHGLENYGLKTYTHRFGPGHIIRGFVPHSGTGTTLLTRYVSAGEDYQLLFYCGPPIIYDFSDPAPSA